MQKLNAEAERWHSFQADVERQFLRPEKERPQMAVSKLWPVTVRLATVLDYAANPEKTTKAKIQYSNADYQALRDVVNYVKDGKKPSRSCSVRASTATRQIAREQFVTVKEQFDKPDGIQAYHGYLSFKGNRHHAGAGAAYRDGVCQFRLGQTASGAVTTHLNTEHLHCHFVINSVSFVDGKRCRETPWFKFYKSRPYLREVRISTIKEPERYPTQKHLTMKDKAGMPARYNLARSAPGRSHRHELSLKKKREVPPVRDRAMPSALQTRSGNTGRSR